LSASPVAPASLEVTQLQALVGDRPGLQLPAALAVAEPGRQGVPDPVELCGNLRDDLLARFRPWVRQLNRKPYARVVAGLVAASQADPEFAVVYREHFVQPRRDAEAARSTRWAYVGPFSSTGWPSRHTSLTFRFSLGPRPK
jgi:hypothetical protein